MQEVLQLNIHKRIQMDRETFLLLKIIMLGFIILHQLNFVSKICMVDPLRRARLCCFML